MRTTENNDLELATEFDKDKYDFTMEDMSLKHVKKEIWYYDGCHTFRREKDISLTRLCACTIFPEGKEAMKRRMRDACLSSRPV